jgi:uncharacterized protein YggE
MKRTTVILGLLFLLQLKTFGQTKNFIDQPYLETVAKVDTLVTPDIIYLDIIIREKDERNKVSVEELESKMILALQSLGIDTEKQLTLLDLASNFKKYFLKQKDIVKSKAYQLKIFEAKTAGKVIVSLEENGISNVAVDRIEYSKIYELKLNLRSKAVLQAKVQADYLVKPLNQNVTRAIHITEKAYEHKVSFNSVLDEVVVVGYGINKKYEAPEIEFSPIRVESEVSVKFAIE